MKTATKAIATCASNGYPVSAVVVDTSGVIKPEAKGGRSTIGTMTSAFRKAYTVVTFGPIFKFEASSAFAVLAVKNPAGPALGTLPDIALLPGAVAIKVGDEAVASGVIRTSMHPVESYVQLASYIRLAEWALSRTSWARYSIWNRRAS